eukprot:1138906-Pelagomonas_calceolata.AAC.1
MPAKRLCTLRKGFLTSMLAREPPKGPQKLNQTQLAEKKAKEKASSFILSKNKAITNSRALEDC